MKRPVNVAVCSVQLRAALSLLPTALYSIAPRFEFVEIAEHLGQLRTPSRFYRLPCMSLQLKNQKQRQTPRSRGGRKTARAARNEASGQRGGLFRAITSALSLLPTALYSIAPRFEFVEIAEHLGQLRTPSRFYRLPCMSLQLKNQKQRQTPRSRGHREAADTAKPR